MRGDSNQWGENTGAVAEPETFLTSWIRRVNIAQGDQVKKIKSETIILVLP